MEKDDEAKPWITWKTMALALLGASGFLVQLWVGYVDQQLTGHLKRLYQHESELALLEAENERLRKDQSRLESQYYTLCRKTRDC